MEKNILGISPNELELMEYMWDSPSPQTSITLGNYFVKWKNGYLHNLLKCLTEKKFLKISGTQLVGTHYVKLYTPNITKEEYGAQILASLSLDESSIPKIAMAFCKLSTNCKLESIICNMQEMVDDFVKKSNIEDEK